MLRDNKIWVANNDAGEGIFLLPRMANRHGLIAGATGTGKTVTARIMAETFSEMGVPVFMADVKGDLAGLMFPGTDSADMQERIAHFALTENGFAYIIMKRETIEEFGVSDEDAAAQVSTISTIEGYPVWGLFSHCRCQRKRDDL